MKKTYLLLLTVFLAASLFQKTQAQVIWSEDFTYADGTTTGANNNTANPAADWTVTCATCLTNDWFEIRNNMMEARDTNGPAILTTEVIDISGYPNGVEFLVDIEESGTMETCNGVACGCICLDWVKVEYSVNGGAFIELTHPNGGSCPGATCSNGDYVAMGDFAAFTITQCPIIGNTLQIRLSCQNWAGSEYHRFDNLIVQEEQCILFEEGTVPEVRAAIPKEPQVFPNPFAESLHVKVDPEVEIRELVMTDVFGKVAYRASYRNTSDLELPLSSLPAQTYLYRISTATAVYHGKVLKY
jgi:hypothetical protein